MAQLWPWLFLAGLGALHGLSPANGWLFAAACGVRARDGAAARRALESATASRHRIPIGAFNWPRFGPEKVVVAGHVGVTGPKNKNFRHIASCSMRGCDRDVR